MRMTPIFTVLLAVNRPPVCLPFAIKTVLAQTVEEFELFIVCDGASRETVEYAQGCGHADPRIKVFDLAKSDRFGESNWHAALLQASGRYVAHIEDDDLWFPNHLAELRVLLEEVDFGQVVHVWARPDGGIEALPSDLRISPFRRQFSDRKFNRIGFSVCGYRLEAYRGLAEGWAPGPEGLWPDLNMWRKFLVKGELKFDTRMVVTALVLISTFRKEQSLAERERESRIWFERIASEGGRAKIIEAAWRSIVDKEIDLERRLCETEAELAHVLNSWSWWVRKPLRAARRAVGERLRALRGK